MTKIQFYTNILDTINKPVSMFPCFFFVHHIVPEVDEYKYFHIKVNNGVEIWLAARGHF